MEGCGNDFAATELQADTFDNNITAVVEELDFVQDKLENFNMVNVTGLVPTFVEDITFGTQCQWGEGASYNLIACLIYFACGMLLCCTPKPNPICGGKEADSSDNKTNTNLSGSDDADLATQNKNSEIV